MTPNAREISMVRVDLIDVLNSRERDGRVFREIVDSIQNVGLKKPITVTRRIADDGTERYLLVCGEGRLMAFKELQQKHIPAQIVEADDDDAFIMGMVENIARRHARPLELLAGIQVLAEKGYAKKAIAAKTGLRVDYVQGVLLLLREGEGRLLSAVQRGALALSTATQIVQAGDNDAKLQEVLHEACETGGLTVKQMLEARRIVERRRITNKRKTAAGDKTLRNLTATKLVRIYQNEVARQTEVVRKSDGAQRRLLFVVGALRRLLADEHFVTLLRAEGLITLPAYLAERVRAGANPS